MRVVLDANVLVSVLISRRGAPGKILDAWENERFDLVVSPSILAELERVVHYPKIQEKYMLPLEYIQRFLRLIGDQTVMVNPAEEIHIIQVDASDNRYLECARAGDASYLVTGDKHLLELGEYEGIVILPPAGFLAVLRIGK
jgi:putative PIN family toxin of toxin-antitoxin system